jgi:hypothetical protein
LLPEKIDYDIDAGRDAWRVCCPQKRLRSHFILSQMTLTVANNADRKLDLEWKTELVEA